MTDEKLDALEAVCRGKADDDGTIRIPRRDALDLIAELRELRRHAVALTAHEGAVATLHRVLANLCAYREHHPGMGSSVSGHIAVQDPGR